MGFLLKLVDKIKIIHLLLIFINAIPIKRPFRGNSRNLLKSGELEKIIEEKWQTIANHISSGNNIFLFPEGTYTYNGFVNSPRKGIYLLKEKVPNLKVVNVSISYDSLSYKKTDVHAALGKLEEFPNFSNREEMGVFIREKIAKDIILHHGNISSFLFFQECFKYGIKEFET